MVRRTARFYGPIVELSRLQGELNRLFAAFVETNNRAGTPAGTSWDPNVDVLDDGETIQILVELPGVEAGDVRVTIRGRVAHDPRHQEGPHPRPGRHALLLHGALLRQAS